MRDVCGLFIQAQLVRTLHYLDDAISDWYKLYATYPEPLCDMFNMTLFAVMRTEYTMDEIDRNLLPILVEKKYISSVAPSDLMQRLWQHDWAKMVLDNVGSFSSPQWTAHWYAGDSPFKRKSETTQKCLVEARISDYPVVPTAILLSIAIPRMCDGDNTIRAVLTHPNGTLGDIIKDFEHSKQYLDTLMSKSSYLYDLYENISTPLISYCNEEFNRDMPVYKQEGPKWVQ